MNRALKQLAITLFFIGQLTLVWWLNAREKRADDEGEDVALSRYGFYLRECAKECGIDFQHEGPQQLDSRLSHIAPIIASMGAGVSVVDYDRDGWLDLYVISSREGGKNRLFRNKGDGTFEEVAERLGIADLNPQGAGVCQGAVWGDFDGDGYEDLFVYRWGRPDLYRNNQGRGFTRVTNAGLPEWVNSNAAIWLDYDRDGHLDLFIAGYWADDVNLWQLRGTRIMPTSFEYANNGGRKYLLRNKGDGTFEDVTAAMGITSTRWTLGVSAADLCGSGYLDIILANDYGVSEYLCNRQGQRFVEIGAATGIGVKPKSGMSVNFGDIDNSGRFAIYITNISERANLMQGNNLWVPRPQRAEGAWRYLNMADNLNVSYGGWSWGAQFGDLNNDGWQDLYLTNGYISADRNASYWYDYSLIAGANSQIIHDATLWPAMRGRSLSGFQQKCLWLNRRGEFVDIAQAVGVHDVFDGRAVVLADLFNRGVLDVIVANQGGPLLLYKNTVAPGRDWVQFHLRASGGNTSAIGAQVRLTWSSEGRSHEQIQVVTGGNGYASQTMRPLHFGLGTNARIENAVIQWPSGRSQTLTAPTINTRHTIQEAVR